MSLTQAQRVIVEKARALGGGRQGVALDDSACTYLVATIAKDLGLRDHFPEFRAELAPFFGSEPLASLRISNQDFLALFERLVTLEPDADTYFACLSALHKSRLKYERILRTQPIPTIDQVGPRGLLQYGSLGPKALTALLFWRKWVFDIDNRAAQETGYLFEPIIAAAIGGAPASARSSPVLRQGTGRGRQVDCLKGDKAFEIKLRVTIAASGQGRWQEELDFPADCRASGYTPVLLVLDPTPSPKLTELQRAFLDRDGAVYVGDDAWAYLADQAGRPLDHFLRKYVREPIQTLLAEVPAELPELVLRMDRSEFTASLAGEELRVQRTPPDSGEAETDEH